MEEEEDIINLKRNTNAPDMFCQEANDDRSSSASSINSEKNRPAVQPTISVKQLNNFRKQWQGLQVRGSKTSRSKHKPQESKTEHAQTNKELSVTTAPDAIPEPGRSDTPAKLTAQQQLKARVQNNIRPDPPLVDNYHILASSKEIKGMAARRTVQSSYGVRRRISIHSNNSNIQPFTCRGMTNCQTVKDIKMATYLRSRDNSNNSDLSFVQSFPETRIKLSANVPLQILDGMIGKQELQEGGGVYNRGQKLKKSLINLDRVKNYLKGTNSKKGVTQSRLPGAQKLDFMDNTRLDEHVQWRLMMEYFKGNPAALLDALPSPRKSGSLPKEETKLPVYDEVQIKTEAVPEHKNLNESDPDAFQLTLTVKDAKVRVPIKHSRAPSSQISKISKNKEMKIQNNQAEYNTEIQNKKVKRLPPLKKRNQPIKKHEQIVETHSSIDHTDARHLVGLLDWYQTSLFRKIVLNGEPDPLERSEKYIDTDAVETLLLQIKQYRAKRGINCDELISNCDSRTKACWDTIAYIATEIFGAQAAEIEYKGQKASEVYTVTQVPERFQAVWGQKILTLENLVKKVDQLHSLRKDIIQYLDTTIKARERTIQQMRLTVSKITNDDFFYANAEEGNFEDTTAISSENPRLYMKKLGNQLVELTETLFKTSKHFLNKVSRHFNHVRVETLIFQEADYVDVACKETEEISAILASYDIFLNVMDLQLIQQK